MTNLRAVCRRIAGLFGRDARDRELGDELESHIAMHVEDNLRAGMPAEEARRQALVKLGGMEQTKARYRAQRTLPWVESLLQDTRFGLRTLRKNPVFAATAIVSLSLAIGANTAVYSIIDAAMLRAMPVPQPERLFTLSTPESNRPGPPDAEGSDAFSYPLYQQLSEAAGNSAQLALFDSPAPAEVQPFDPNAPPEKAVTENVSPNAFEMLGVAPAEGQFFSSTEDGYPPSRMAAVVSYQYWQARFGGDPQIVGKTLTVGGRTFFVVGVTRKGFSGIEPGKSVDVWLPITTGDAGIFTNAEYRAFHLVGRLAPGMTGQQLEAKLQPDFHHHQEERIAANAAMPAELKSRLARMSLTVGPGAEGVSGFRQTFARPLWLLLGVSICILLIACANVASLLLARSAARSGEMALRTSLGAARGRLIRQLLTESLLISAFAVPGAWAVARAAAPTLVAMVSTPSDPVRFDLSLDTRALIVCALACCASSLFFGVVPAWNASDARPMFALRRAGGQTGSLRLGRVFVGIQVAFAFCLVTSGAGFLFSLLHLAEVNRGFDARGVTVLTITNTRQGDSTVRLHDRQWTVMKELLARTGELPGVQGAATAWMAVFSGDRRAQHIVLPGKPPSDDVETFYRVSPGYFSTVGTPLLAGRDFTFSDNDNEPVPTVVNRAFARKYFGSESVIGREFRRDDGALHQIVGLAADSHFGSLLHGPERIAYMPMKPPQIFTFYVHATAGPGAVSKMVQKEADSIGAGAFVSDVTTLDALVGDSILRQRLLGTIGGALALLGLLLAAIGLFGLLNYTVTRRTREIGIRAAIGAPRAHLFALVAKEIFGLVGIGVAIGMIGSLAVMRAAHSLLFDVAPADPAVIVTALGVFICAAAIAAAIPARRAANIDPMTALRQE